MHMHMYESQASILSVSLNLMAFESYFRAPKESLGFHKFSTLNRKGCDSIINGDTVELKKETSRAFKYIYHL